MCWHRLKRELYKRGINSHSLALGSEAIVSSSVPPSAVTRLAPSAPPSPPLVRFSWTTVTLSAQGWVKSRWRTLAAAVGCWLRYCCRLPYCCSHGCSPAAPVPSDRPLPHRSLVYCCPPAQRPSPFCCPPSDLHVLSRRVPCCLSLYPSGPTFVPLPPLMVLLRKSCPICCRYPHLLLIV